MPEEISKKQFNFMIKRALKGNGDSQWWVGTAYLKGQIVPKNFHKAMYWFKRSTKSANTTDIIKSKSYAEIGTMHFFGNGVEESNTNALFWFIKASRLNNIYAQEKLGHMRRWGWGVTQSFDKALFWQNKALKNGSLHANYDIGGIFECSDYHNTNIYKAVSYYKAGAKAGCKYAQYMLALTYETDEHFQKDNKQIEALYLGSADQRYIKAYSALGWFYLEQHQYEKAYLWLKKSADLGDSHGQRGIGSMYHRGLFVEKDTLKAIKWYLKSSIQGNPTAQEWLPSLYLEVKDYQNSFHWFSILARTGHDEAQYNLGIFYLMGLGVKNNHQKSFKWFLKSARQGHPKSQYNLGVMYSEGRGVEVDKEQSKYWFGKASQQGITIAQRLLGTVDKDDTRLSTHGHEQDNAPTRPETLH